MSEIIETAKILRGKIDELPLFIELNKIEKLYKENKELNALKIEIVKAKQSGDINKHNELLEKFNSNPLVRNYNSLKEEAISYLKEISSIIQDKK